MFKVKYSFSALVLHISHIHRATDPGSVDEDNHHQNHDDLCHCHPFIAGIAGMYHLVNIIGLVEHQHNTGCFFFHGYPPKKLKYGTPRLGESTLT